MRLLLCFIYSTMLLTTDHIVAHSNSHSIFIEEVISEVIENCFMNVPRHDIAIVPIKGGHSNTTLKISIKGSDYVLRIQDKATSQNNLERELYAMETGMRLGIAPKIYYVSADRRAMLMEYVQKNTLSWLEAKHPLICIAIAQAISKAHTTEKNPFVEETINETAYRLYKTIAHTPGIESDLDEAVKLMERYTMELECLPCQKVNIHGDLNPRNIFILDREAIFIDWEYTGWEDPFFDLSYYAIRLDYNLDEEMLLINSYLQRSPTENELRRYSLTKKIHLSQFCIFFYYFSLKFNQGEVFSNNSHLSNSFSDCMKKFSDINDDEENPAQFYYDLAKICLELARANPIEINTIQ